MHSQCYPGFLSYLWRMGRRKGAKKLLEFLWTRKFSRMKFMNWVLGTRVSFGPEILGGTWNNLTAPISILLLPTVHMLTHGSIDCPRYLSPPLREEMTTNSTPSSLMVSGFNGNGEWVGLIANLMANSMLNSMVRLSHFAITSLMDSLMSFIA